MQTQSKDMFFSTYSKPDRQQTFRLWPLNNNDHQPVLPFTFTPAPGPGSSVAGGGGDAAGNAIIATLGAPEHCEVNNGHQGGRPADGRRCCVVICNSGPFATLKSSRTMSD